MSEAPIKPTQPESETLEPKKRFPPFRRIRHGRLLLPLLQLLLLLLLLLLPPPQSMQNTCSFYPPIILPNRP